MFTPWPTNPSATLADLFDHRTPCPDGAIPDPKTLPATGGVYLIVDAEDRPVFLSYGQSLRRLITHRLSPPAEDERTKRTNLAEIAAAVCWRETFSPAANARLEAAAEARDQAIMDITNAYQWVLQQVDSWLERCYEANGCPSDSWGPDGPRYD